MKFISFIIALGMLVSCTKQDDGLDPQTSAAWIANKQWRVASYTVTTNGNTVAVTEYNNYNLDFRPNFEVDVNTGQTIAAGSWAVYLGVNGNLFQLSYSEIGNPVHKLRGTWSIDNQTMTTIELRQGLNNSTLKVNLEQIQ